MKKTIPILLSLVMLLNLLCACGTSEPPLITDVAAKCLTAELTANPPTVATQDATPVLDFGLNMLKQSAGAENATYSPLSAYLALALAADGASGQTKAQFEQLLGGDQQQYDSLSRNLINRLTQTDGSTKVEIANSVWIQQDFPANGDYLQNAVDYFDADIFTADLPTNATCEAINQWVSDKTNGEIPKMMEKNANSNAVLLLLNALYFDGKWETPFPSGATGHRDFHTGSGQTIPCDFMVDDEHTRLYFAEDGMDGVILSYDCGRYAMMAIRPATGDLNDLLQMLDAQAIRSALENAQETDLLLRIPKFSFDTGMELNQMLQDMGLTEAFGAQADFSALTDGKNEAYISEVVQKVKIGVAEDGTRAAAATKIELAEKAACIEPPQEVCFDHPFVYCILDTETAAPLFLGTVTNPAA